MNIFLTSYTAGELGENLNAIYMSMDKSLNEKLAAKDYGPGLSKWFLMFIMVPPQSRAANDPERILFKKKDKVIDLRLHLSNEAFRQSDESGRKALVVDCMLRSLDLIAAKKIPDFDIAALKADVSAIAQQEDGFSDLRSSIKDQIAACIRSDFLTVRPRCEYLLHKLHRWRTGRKPQRHLDVDG